MKKISISIALFGLMFSGVAFGASPSQTNTGCGLGTVLFGDNAKDSILLQVFAVTTNGTLGNQTFGISSGTSECSQPAKIVKNERLNEFVVANVDNLAKDIAKGNGESLDTLAELINLPSHNRPALYQRLQANFARIFPSEKVEAAQVIDNLVTVINS